MPLSSACLLWRDSTPNGIYAKHWEAVKLSEEEILSWEQVGVLSSEYLADTGRGEPRKANQLQRLEPIRVSTDVYGGRKLWPP